MTRAERVAALQNASEAAKGRVMSRIQQLKRQYPELAVTLDDTAFPALVVEGSERALRALHEDATIRASITRVQAAYPLTFADH